MSEISLDADLLGDVANDGNAIEGGKDGRRMIDNPWYLAAGFKQESVWRN